MLGNVVAMGTQFANSFIFITSVLRVSEAALWIFVCCHWTTKRHLDVGEYLFLAFKNVTLPFSFFTFGIFYFVKKNNSRLQKWLQGKSHQGQIEKD